jgi:8-oxo-dGTP pyrophosphatase MutT (NUDIX family)
MAHEVDALRAALARPAQHSSDFDLNPAFPQPPGQVLRPAAVLVAIQPAAEGARLFLTKRASHLKHHPGQIAFPGGKQDEGDATLEATALREAWEEIGLPGDQVEILGRLAPHETVTSFTMTPVLGLVRAAFAPRVDPAEVEEMFTVPLSHVLDRSRYRVEGRVWRGTMRRYYAVPYGPYYIWGATARILRGLAERVAG